MKTYIYQVKKECRIIKSFAIGERGTSFPIVDCVRFH